MTNAEIDRLVAEQQRLSANAPTIEKQIAELKDAGWLSVSRLLWKAPVGGYFRGPHGAWLAMKRREGATGIAAALRRKAVGVEEGK